MREKLIVLLAECFDKCLKSRCTECDHFNAPPIAIGNNRSCQAHLFADALIANGVTVGKPLAQFLYPVDAYAGLKAKYLVFKGDTGEKVENCFVLRPDKDPAAVEALRAYARATENETLAQDIYNWVGQGEPVQRWIPVTERLPENEVNVLICAERRFYGLDDKRKIVRVIATAFHTDGETNTENSGYNWDIDNVDMDYDEEDDAYIVPDGWWEAVRYGEEFSAVDDVVTHWMPLPEPPKGE